MRYKKKHRDLPGSLPGPLQDARRHEARQGDAADQRPDKSARDRAQREFLRHGNAIRCYICSLLPHEGDVDDVYQETFVTVLEKAEECDFRAPFLPWVFTIAKFKVMALVRDQQRQSRRTLSSASIELLAAAVPEDHATEDQLNALRQCIRRLSPAARRVVQLRYFDRSTGEGIARQLGINVQSVYNALDRARAALRECIRRALS